MFGPMMPAVLKIAQRANQADLVSECPIYKELAESKKADRRGFLKTGIKALQIKRKATSLHVNITPGMMEAFQTGRWGRISATSLTSGLFNPFLYGPSDEEAATAANFRAHAVQSGRATANLTTLSTILKVNVNLPLDDNAPDNLRRLKLVLTLLLPKLSTLLVWAQAFLVNVTDYSSKWRAHEMDDSSLQFHKGTVLLQYFGNRVTTHLGRQWQTALTLQLEAPDAIISKIEDQLPWAPVMPVALRSALRIPQQGAAMHVPPTADRSIASGSAGAPSGATRS